MLVHLSEETRGCARQARGVHTQSREGTPGIPSPCKGTKAQEQGTLGSVTSPRVPTCLPLQAGYVLGTTRAADEVNAFRTGSLTASSGVVPVTWHEAKHRGQSPEAADSPAAHGPRGLWPLSPSGPQLSGRTSEAVGPVIISVQTEPSTLKYTLILQPKHLFWVT